MEQFTTAESLKERLSEMASGKWRTAIRMVDTALICPNPFHLPVTFPEDELQVLARKLRTDGIRNPLTIRAVGTAHHPMFQLVAGEKRYQACLFGNISPVPCVVLDANPDVMVQTADIPLPRNMFEEAEMLVQLLKAGDFTPSGLAERLKITESALQNKLSLLDFDSTERKLILISGISCDAAVRIFGLTPAARCEFYIAVQNGIRGKDAEALLLPPPPKKKEVVVIKDIRLFYNTIDKAIAIMQKSGVNITCKKEEGKRRTRLLISIPQK